MFDFTGICHFGDTECKRNLLDNCFTEGSIIAVFLAELITQYVIIGPNT